MYYSVGPKKKKKKYVAVQNQLSSTCVQTEIKTILKPKLENTLTNDHTNTKAPSMRFYA